jgi:VWA domain-containing protein
VTFSDATGDRLGFSTPKEAILQKLETMKQGSVDSKGGHTALLDALVEAIQMFDSPQPGDVILLISDGIDNSSRAQLRDVRRRMLERGLRLFSFVPSEEYPMLEDANSSPDSLVSLSRDTGGRSFTLTPDPRMWGWDASKNTLGKDYEFGKYMYVLASTGYELEIKAHQAIRRPVMLNLKIVGPDGEAMRNVQSLYPQELTACAISTQN